EPDRRGAHPRARRRAALAPAGKAPGVGPLGGPHGRRGRGRGRVHAVSVPADPEVRSWAVVRSVSKSLGPDLRLAVASGDQGTIARMESRQGLGTGWVSTILQRMVAGMWASPEVAASTAAAEAAYAERRGRLIPERAAR